ncbi:MAG: nitroreductase family protein [Methanobacteriaceae archaeon]|nr:nitroreductase family protein [Candidatus Methanorudis spinitermitis]
MKDIFNVIHNRRSVREYTGEQLKDEEIEKILNAGIMAPTAKAEEPWYFTVIQNKELLKKINETSLELMKNSGDKLLESIANSRRNILHNAPTVIVVSGYEKASHMEADCSAAIENMLLAAEGLNIGSCWIGLIASYFKDEKNVASLKIPKGYVPLYGISFGYKANDNQENPKRNNDVVNWIR